MNEIKRRYKNKCKKRQIVFYLKDKELYEKSKTINFQKFVKDCLQNKDKIYTFIINERGVGRKCWEENKRKVKDNGKTNL